MDNLQLERHLTLDAEAIKSPNLCNRFSDKDLKNIGAWVYQGFQRDLTSRNKWQKRNEAGMDLAMQLQKEKNFPWPGAANVAFPLITIAALQFHARAYPAIVSGNNLVKMQIWAEDPQGQIKQQADRISKHMSYQLLEEDADWEEQHDNMLINLAIIGTTFKKTYYEGGEGYVESEFVLARDLVVDYYTKSLEHCPRATHVIPLFRNEIWSRCKRGVFRDVLNSEWYQGAPTKVAEASPTQQRVDQRAGQTPPMTLDETAPFSFLEQHVDLDLDGDGYAEPYIVTIEYGSQDVVRIVTRFDSESAIERNGQGEIISVRPLQYFTRYLFLPSPDGGFYGMGFGVLLGPLNESVNTAINQIFDAGTMATLGGGFLGKGAKIRGGVYTFKPNEWKRVDSTGDDLRKSIVPLDIKEPSQILFQLLVLLIEYTNRISGAMDQMVGETPGQNTPAETSRTVLEQGMKIYNSIFKRVWRGMKEEFRKVFILNGLFLPTKKRFGEAGSISREDYLVNPRWIRPAADPNISSSQERFNKAQAVKASAATTPGYNADAVEMYYLKALEIDAPETLYVGREKAPPGEDVKVTIAKLKLQGDQGWLKLEQMKMIQEGMEEQRINSAEIAKIAAEIQIAQKTAQGDDLDRQVNFLNSLIAVRKTRNEELNSRIETMMRMLEMKHEREIAEIGSSTVEKSASN